MMSDDPPSLMNGSVIPVTGRSATTTAMLMNSWMHSQPVIRLGPRNCRCAFHHIEPVHLRLVPNATLIDKIAGKTNAAGMGKEEIGIQ